MCMTYVVINLMGRKWYTSSTIVSFHFFTEYCASNDVCSSMHDIRQVVEQTSGKWHMSNSAIFILVLFLKSYFKWRLFECAWHTSNGQKNERENMTYVKSVPFSFYLCFAF